MIFTSQPRLPLLESSHARAYRAIAARLRGNETLRRVVRTWVDWDVAAEPIEITESTCPHVTLTPAPLASEWAGEGRHRADLAIEITLHTAGHSVIDVLNLWDAVRFALFVAQFDQESTGIIQRTMTQPAARFRRLPDGSRGWSAVGQIRLTMYQSNYA